MVVDYAACSYLSRKFLTLIFFNLGSRLLDKSRRVKEWSQPVDCRSRLQLFLARIYLLSQRNWRTLKKAPCGEKCMVRGNITLLPHHPIFSLGALVSQNIFLFLSRVVSNFSMSSNNDMVDTSKEHKTLNEAVLHVGRAGLGNEVGRWSTMGEGEWFCAAWQWYWNMLAYVCFSDEVKWKSASWLVLLEVWPAHLC